MIGEWVYAVVRPAGSHRLCWSDISRGRYAIDAQTPVPGSFRAWFEPHGQPAANAVYLGDAGSLRDALALVERDRSWALDHRAN